MNIEELKKEIEEQERNGRQDIYIKRSDYIELLRRGKNLC